jgi:hypothetical protein
MNVSAQKTVLKRIEDSVSKVRVSDSTKNLYEFSLPDLPTVYDKGNQASILLGCKRIMDSAEMVDFIKTSNYGPYVPELWPIVTAWYPEFPLKELISVQGMDRPLTYMAFSQLRTGTTKAGTVAGQLVETATGYRNIQGAYPTGEVQGEELVTADFAFDNTDKLSVGALVYYPLTLAHDYSEKYSIAITSTNSALNGKWAYDHVSGDTIYFVKGSDNTSVTLDVTTGALTIKEDAAAVAGTVSKAVVFYVWDIQVSDQNTLPQIIEDIKLISMEARPRALALKWSIFSEYVKKSQFGTDIRTDTTKRVLSLLFQYQCRYILDTMYNFSTETEVTVTIPISNITVESKCQEVLNSLGQTALKIAANTGRMFGNKIVVDRSMRAWLESLPDTYFKRNSEGDKGYDSPYALGTFGQFQIFYDPNQIAGKGFMTYRGTEWADAAYYMGEFMPIVPTDAITLGTDVREAFCSMEAHKYHKKNAVIPLKFVLPA